MEEILAKLEVIERNTLLAAKNVLTIGDVSLLTGLSKAYIYKLTSQRRIPFSKPDGKQIYFDRKEIEDWLRRNRIQTVEEVASEAATYCATHKH